MSTPAKNIFRFKQFNVDQSGCAMKINTDGVLLGSLAEADYPVSVLDIGTGTGVIALMLAQRFTTAAVDAVEIDQEAAATAAGNFASSPFADRVTAHAISFSEYFSAHPTKKYDLIISNPPFYIDSLTSTAEKRKLAKHTNRDFFDILLSQCAQHLSVNGELWLILPVETNAIITEMASRSGLYLYRDIALKSFKDSQPHRKIVTFRLHQGAVLQSEFVIYADLQVYSEAYKTVLANYFINF